MCDANCPECGNSSREDFDGGDGEWPTGSIPILLIGQQPHQQWPQSSLRRMVTNQRAGPCASQNQSLSPGKQELFCQKDKIDERCLSPHMSYF